MQVFDPHVALGLLGPALAAIALLALAFAYSKAKTVPALQSTVAAVVSEKTAALGERDIQRDRADRLQLELTRTLQENAALRVKTDLTGLLKQQQDFHIEVLRNLQETSRVNDERYQVAVHTLGEQHKVQMEALRSVASSLHAIATRLNGKEHE